MQGSTITHLLVAAESGDAAAQFNLGVLYDSRLDDNGYAIEGNRAEAMKWLLAAAERHIGSLFVIPARSESLGARRSGCLLLNPRAASNSAPAHIVAGPDAAMTAAIFFRRRILAPQSTLKSCGIDRLGLVEGSCCGPVSGRSHPKGGRPSRARRFSKDRSRSICNFH